MQRSASRTSVYFLVAAVLALIALSATIAAVRNSSNENANPQAIVRQMFTAYEQSDLPSAERVFCDPQLARVMVPSTDPNGWKSSFSGVRIEAYARESTSPAVSESQNMALVQVTGTMTAQLGSAVETRDLAWAVTTQREAGKWCISSITDASRD